MLSKKEEQGNEIFNAREAKLRSRMLIVARYFLINNDSTIDQVSAATHIPRATVHRYLNSPYLRHLSSELSDICEGDLYDTIQSLLRKLDKKERREKILKVVKYILENRNATIQQISKHTGISESSVQRYLNVEEINEMLKDIGIDNPSEIIKEILKNHRQQAPSSGGTSYAANNIFTKDETGKFTGSRKK